MSDRRYPSSAKAEEGWSEGDTPARSLFEGLDAPKVAELVRLGDAHLRRLARAHPFPLLLGALAAGFVVARLTRAANR